MSPWKPSGCLHVLGTDVFTTDSRGDISTYWNVNLVLLLKQKYNVQRQVNVREFLGFKVIVKQQHYVLCIM